MNFYNKIILSGISILFFIMLISGCDDTITSDELDKRVIPDSNIDYYTHIQPIFSVKCASSFCHDDGTRAGGLSLTSYGNATADLSIVFPGDPSVSKLVWAIEGTGGTQPMPPPGAAPPLTENQIKGIKTWIAEGAKPGANKP